MIKKVVERQLTVFLNKNMLLSKFQFGLKVTLSMELAATLLLDDIRNSDDQGNLVGVTFMDHSKAFDPISRSKLFQKLPQNEIKEGESSWFTDYPFHRSATVHYGKSSSKSTDIHTGVAQGSIFGPFLSILSCNDITDIIEDTRIVKYANDAVMYVADKDLRVIKTKLTKDMESLADVFEKNGLVLNVKKSNAESLILELRKESQNKVRHLT